MKIAISGKGGVGKSTLAAALALMLAQDGQRILAIDADPDANLASALGINANEQQKIVPISEHVALIEERTGAKVKQFGQIFKLNPDVADVAEKFAFQHKNIDLLVLGAIEQGGSGCACPESVLLRALVTDVVLYKNETLILDMEAGVEHLGRATARGVDIMIIVVEPGKRSLDTASRIKRMANDIGITSLAYVANKIYDKKDELYIKQELGDMEFIGSIPFSSNLRQADRDGFSVLDQPDATVLTAFQDILQNIKGIANGRYKT